MKQRKPLPLKRWRHLWTAAYLRLPKTQGKQIGVKKESDGDDVQKGGGSYEEHLLQSEY